MLGGLALKRRWRRRTGADGEPAPEPGDGRKRAGLLGEVLPVLGRRAAGRADGGRPIPPGRGQRPRPRSTRTRSAWSRSSAPPSTAATSRSPRSPPRWTPWQERTGIDVPIHVDGASGAMVAPFLDQDLVWDFRLPRVASINTSGHKYGLVYPGVGLGAVAGPAALPEELVFNVNYLGGQMPTFALNFSRPGAQVVAQYYTFFRLGRQGFRAVQQACRAWRPIWLGEIERARPVPADLAAATSCRCSPSPPTDRSHGLGRLRGLPPAARAGLAGARLHVPAEPGGSRGAAGGLPQRLLPRPGRRPAGGPPKRGDRSPARRRVRRETVRAVRIPALSLRLIRRRVRTRCRAQRGGATGAAAPPRSR